MTFVKSSKLKEGDVEVDISIAILILRDFVTKPDKKLFHF